MDVGFAPADPGFIADPYPVYAELRAAAPVYHDDPTDLWFISRYEDVNTMLRDRRFGRTYIPRFTHEEMGREPPPPAQDPFWHLINHGILDMEPPDHTRVRRLVTKAFTPRMVENLREPIQALTDRLVDGRRGSGTFDLIAAVAEPLPVAVIAELLGIPPDDRHLLRPWSADICRMYELHPTDEDAAVAVRASEDFSDYLRNLARVRRSAPGDDLISELTRVVDDGERLTEDDLIGTCVLLLNAGHEATVNATGNGWWTLFRHPPALERLRADPASIRTAVEEMLRWDTPAQMFERWVLEDVEVQGVAIPKGAEVGLLFGSADRDPEVFDEADAFRIDRDPNPHLTFGAGIHFCSGAALARLELTTSFATVLRALPDLTLVDEPAWKPNYVVRGLQELLVSA